MKDNRKMKIGRYISIAITTLIFFIASWVLTNLGENSNWGPYVWAIAGIMMVIYFTSISLNILGFSITGLIKVFKNFKEEKGLWKILTLIFRIGMLIFGILIFIFWIVWLVSMIKDGFTGKISDKDINWLENLGLFSKWYITGISGISITEFNLYVTSFVFILIWAAAGIAFEIIKRMFGGYRKRDNENNNSSSHQTTTASF